MGLGHDKQDTERDGTFLKCVITAAAPGQRSTTTTTSREGKERRHSRLRKKKEERTHLKTISSQAFGQGAEAMMPIDSTDEGQQHDS